MLVADFKTGYVPVFTWNSGKESRELKTGRKYMWTFRKLHNDKIENETIGQSFGRLPASRRQRGLGGPLDENCSV